jgi:hypothetical protein
MFADDKEKSMRPDLSKAREFILGNARLLDRKRFAFRFEDGAAEDVLAALLPYQNADGGFGNALEPDMRCAPSQPVSTELALEILDELGELHEETVRRCCEWLSSVTTVEGGLPWVLATVEEGPHAPWWKATGKTSLNPTTGIVGLLQKHGVNHPWVNVATEYCWRRLEAGALDGLGPDDALSILRFLEWTTDRKRAIVAFDVLGELIKSSLVAYDPHSTGYVKVPLDFATSPDRMAYRLFDADMVSTHLDALAQRQQADGGWPISWAPPSPAAICEWRAHVTIKCLVVLDGYGRLRGGAAV